MNRPIYDVYKQRIDDGDTYFYGIDERIHLHNICQYLEERHNDQFVSTIDSDEDLIKYVEDNYFYDTLIYKTPVFVDFI